MRSPGRRYYEAMHSALRVVFLVTALAVVVGACSGDDDGEGTTTTSTEATVTSLADAGTDDASNEDTAGSESTTTSSTLAPSDDEVAIPTFSIVSREPGDEGDTVVVLLDPESYDTITDIDLQNVLSVVVDDFPPVYEAHVVDDEAVTELVVAAAGEIDADEQQLLDVHYLVRLEEGFRIIYVGPFAETPTAILGS